MPHNLKKIKHAMDKHIESNIKKLREANGFTQEQLADYLNVSRSAYSSYETGDRNISLQSMEKLAKLFGCKTSILYSENSPEMKDILACAFRVDNLSAKDIKEIANFKDVVMNYLKINRLLKK